MKIWTVQSNAVVDCINQKGIYFPNFLKSEELKLNPELVDLYTFLLNSYNKVNKMATLGLVFGFMGIERSNIFGFQNIDDFYNNMVAHRSAVESLWTNLVSRRDMVIMELEYDNDKFNPLFIDLNDFQFLMPPIMVLPPYVDDDVNRLLHNLSKGTCAVSTFPSGIIQTHSPYISRDNVKGLYSPFLLV